MDRQAAPEFSVVIPTYDRPRLLERCLHGLVETLSPAGGFEVIVVDDGGPEPLDPLEDAFAGQLDLRLYRQRNQGPAAARNLGVRVARGRWVAFLDDDCIPEPEWLRGFASALDDGLYAGAGGLMVSRPDDSTFSIASNLLVAYLCDYFDSVDHAQFFPTANLVVEREAFLALGGFDESFRLAAAEDRDLCDRWNEHGLAIRVAVDAVVHHSPKLSLGGFVRQHFNYGRGACHLHEARRRRGVAAPRVEPFRFYSGLLLSPLRFHTERSPLVMVPLMLITQVANAAGYYAERAGALGRRRAAPSPAADSPVRLSRPVRAEHEAPTSAPPSPPHRPRPESGPTTADARVG